MRENRSGFALLTEHGDAAHPDLEHWHGNIGEPIALDLGAPLPRKANVIDVVTWNVGIGLGRIAEFVTRLRAGELDGEERSMHRPLIILAQEAYRADVSIPEAIRSGFHGGKDPAGERTDIVDAARALGFSLRYAPSMRNGRHRSDRGNAILSSVSINHARAFTLPHVRQRRAVVAAELHALPWITFVSAHLDTRGRPQGTGFSLQYAAGRRAQAHGLARRLADEWGTDQTVIVGADMNTYLGGREPLLHALKEAGFTRVPHEPSRSHTFHALPLKMLLDHIFVRVQSAAIASIHVRRLDENPRDRGKYIFGSDHHPLLARIELTRLDRRIRRR